MVLTAYQPKASFCAIKRRTQFSGIMESYDGCWAGTSSQFRPFLISCSRLGWYLLTLESSRIWLLITSTVSIGPFEREIASNYCTRLV